MRLLRRSARTHSGHRAQEEPGRAVVGLTRVMPTWPPSPRHTVRRATGPAEKPTPDTGPSTAALFLILVFPEFLLAAEAEQPLPKQGELHSDKVRGEVIFCAAVQHPKGKPFFREPVMPCWWSAVIAGLSGGTALEDSPESVPAELDTLPSYLCVSPGS